jgi:uncharacterized Zn finger protein
MNWSDDEVVYDADGDSGRSAGSARVEKKLAQLRKEGVRLEPTLPTAKRDLSATFWGRAWNLNLMAYSHYESRMPQGRTFFRKGGVLGLEVATGEVRSYVVGKDVYEVIIRIRRIEDEVWAALRARCQGKIADVMDLLAGELSDEVMREVTALEDGLFPSDGEMKLSCTCPDYADMCPHCAATLYAVGALLDGNPRHLFTLRGVDAEELIGSVATTISALTTPDAPSEDRVAALDGEDLSALFGVALSAEAAAD